MVVVVGATMGQALLAASIRAALRHCDPRRVFKVSPSLFALQRWSRSLPQLQKQTLTFVLLVIEGQISQGSVVYSEACLVLPTRPRRKKGAAKMLGCMCGFI
ncbi:unnamed protein product [Symbiodinium natans]|uniref:Uncharacterized protein n=1 Tax=Symbiodinium natans TaxID=878477 RepID=A0A812N5P5_9DINO|nr:unnamed protein product [Symbiodinium natans]